MSPRPAFLASLVAAGPSSHEATSFTAYATLPLSELGPFRRSFEIEEDPPRDGVAWEPPVVLMTARWPVAGEPDEAVLAEASLLCCRRIVASGRVSPATAAHLLALASGLMDDLQAAAPPARARA